MGIGTMNRGAKSRREPSEPDSDPPLGEWDKSMGMAALLAFVLSVLASFALGIF